MAAVAMEPVGMETVGMVRTDETGDWVLVPDSMTSWNEEGNQSELSEQSAHVAHNGDIMTIKRCFIMICIALWFP